MRQVAKTDFFELESSIWLAERKTGVPAYDFQFSSLFKIERPRTEVKATTVARIGAISNYDGLYKELLASDFELINTPKQHHLASVLEAWYPLINRLTPKSVVYHEVPSVEEVLEQLDFPLFIKGNRQTAKHDPSLSIARNRDDFSRITSAYQNNEILHWQKMVCRQLVALRALPYQVADKVPISFEFRTFWWKGQFVAAGHYWSQHLEYTWTETEKREALAVAQQAVKLLEIPFLVIDMAMTSKGEWIIIECNDAQESGYCGVNPIALWRNIVNAEDENTDSTTGEAPSL